MWILKFVEDSTRLSNCVDTFVDWLANGSPPWAAYREFMSGRLIVIDKQPGVRLVGYRRNMTAYFCQDCT